MKYLTNESLNCYDIEGITYLSVADTPVMQVESDCAEVLQVICEFCTYLHFGVQFNPLQWIPIILTHPKLFLNLKENSR